MSAIPSQTSFSLANQRLHLLEEIQESDDAHLRQDLEKLDESFLKTAKVTNYIGLKNLWKLGVDGQDHNKDRLSYDLGTNTDEISEPGYIDAMETALGFMFQTVDEPISIEYIHQLHFLSCSGVDLESGIDCGTFENDLRSLTTGRLPLCCKKYITKEGLLEMLSYDFFDAFFLDENFDEQKLTVENVDKFLAMLSSRNEGGEAQFRGNPLPVLARLIEEYNQNIKKDAPMDQKILVIATFLKKVETLHRFRDGNLRTVRLLLLKCLIQNNLPLSCIMDPNIIDGHSSKQVADAIFRGMEVYKKIAP